MIRPGLCSVTCRALQWRDVVALAARHRVRVIEWGGDIHLPPGELGQARQIRAECEARSIIPFSYGSYVRAGNKNALEDFRTALETASALGAQNIRVWAGTAKRQDSGEEDLSIAANDLREMACQAADKGVSVSVEYHRNSLTEEAEDAVALLTEANHPNLYSYWQPVPGRGIERWLEELKTLAPFLGDLHVFHWVKAVGGQERRPLGEGGGYWQILFDHWSAPRWPHPPTAYLEFVRDDDPAQLEQDMKQLHTLCSGELRG